MPPTVANWPDVKATAIHTGSLLEAAEIHGIKYETVRQRACREKWPVGRRVHQQLQQAQEAAATQIIRASHGNVTSVTSASEAALATLADGARRTKLGLTKYAARMAEEAAETGTLEEAPLYKAVADIHGKMHPEANGEDRVGLMFFEIRVSQPDESPIIDVAGAGE
jgi:hypothetical protein